MSFRVQNHIIEISDPDTGQWLPLCEEFGVKEVQANLLTGKHQVILEAWPSTGVCETVLPRSALKRDVIPSLLDMGVTLYDEDTNIPHVLEIALTSDQQAPRKLFHDKLGFQEVDGKIGFLLHHPVGLTDPKKQQSVYIDSEALEPQGTLDDWLDMVNTEVLGHANMEVILALGLTGPVSHILKEAKKISDNPIFSLINESSRGKTGALRLISSIWASGEENGHYILNLNSTELAFYAQLEKFWGMTILLDETTLQPGWDFSQAAYRLSKGSSRLRCNSDGSLKKRYFFSGSFVTSGEVSLISQSSPNLGMRARLLELTQTWTDSAAHAQRLEEKCRTCCATAGPILAKWLLKNRDTVVTLFTRTMQYLQTTYETDNNILMRLYKMIAIVLVCADIWGQVFDLELNTEYIRDTLLEAAKANLPEESLGDRAYNVLMTMILKNRTQFPLEDALNSKQAITYGVWGVKGRHKGFPCVWIVEGEFIKCLKQACLTDTIEVCKALYTSNRIFKHGDKYRIRHKIGGLKVICYCLKVIDDTEESIKKREELEAEKKAAAELRKLREEERKAQQEALLAEEDDDFEFDEFPEEESDPGKTDGTAVEE